MEHTIDLQQMIFGEGSPVFLIEIAIRASVMYLYTIALMRLLGQRSLAQLSIGEFSLILALGSAVGDPMFQPDVPLLHGMMVVTVIVLLQTVIVRLAQRSRRVAKVIDGRPIRLVVDGRLDEPGILAARMTHDEVYAELRQNGIDDLGRVRCAWLEQDGEVSVFEFPPSEGRESRSILPAHS